MKHINTPAWRVTADHPALPDGSYRAVVDHHTNECIALVNVPHGNDDSVSRDRERDARAALIAAAPALFHRITDVMEGLEDMKLSGAMPARVQKLKAVLNQLQWARYEP